MKRRNPPQKVTARFVKETYGIERPVLNKLAKDGKVKRYVIPGVRQVFYDFKDLSNLMVEI